MVKQSSLSEQADEDSVQSADSDIFGNSRAEAWLQVIYSQLDCVFHCECHSVKLLGYPCVHILRVIAFKKQKLEMRKNCQVQYSDVKDYFASHITKPPKDDLISFDVTNPVTIDR